MSPIRNTYISYEHITECFWGMLLDARGVQLSQAPHTIQHTLCVCPIKRVLLEIDEPLFANRRPPGEWRPHVGSSASQTFFVFEDCQCLFSVRLIIIRNMYKFFVLFIVVESALNYDDVFILLLFLFSSEEIL